MDRRSIISAYTDRFNAHDEENVIQAVDNAHAADFLTENIPVFLCPDPVMEETYYFRWWTYRKHIKDTPVGPLLSEFHPDVPWAGPYNTINCAACHHIMEGRWLRKGRPILENYIRFWLEGEGDDLSYSSWIADAVCRHADVTGDMTLPLSLLDALVAHYEAREARQMTRYGLFWSDGDRDGMEFGISRRGLRPTLNSYMYANARAIARLAELAGRRELSRIYAHKASVLAERIHTCLWDADARFYKAIPMDSPEEHVPSFDFADIPAARNAREEIGYIPWEFGLDLPGQEAAWALLSDPTVFHAPYGPYTADRSHPCFRASEVHHECLWDGPSWPFATTQTANALIAHLQRDGKGITGAEFMDLMACYTRSHFRTKSDGTRVNWIDENLDGETGDWISRTLLKQWGWPAEKGGYERGKDYNHSAYCDLVIRGICGIIPAEGNVLTVQPLVPAGMWDHFLLEGVSYHGHDVTVCWDAAGTVHGMDRGLSVWVDGICAARREDIGRLEIRL